MRIEAFAAVVLAVVAGCASPPATLGKDCGRTCAGTFCVSTGADVDDICGTSIAEAQCVGSGEQYCTRHCAHDSDCAPAPFEMRCLTACPNQAELSSLCWSVADWTSLSTGHCIAATAAGIETNGL